MEDCSKSVIVKKFGNYDVLSIGSFKLPSLDDNIEIKVHFGGLNFADIYTRQGLFTKTFPFVLGMECMGTITKIGKNVETNLKIGQRVLCYNLDGGLYREIIRVKPEICYPLPNEVSDQIGTALFVNYLTAYFSIFHLGALKPNENVLILSCAGGVGWASTQLAKTVEGVKIYGTVSHGKEKQVTSNGVDHIFLNDNNLESEIKKIEDGFDLIISNKSGTFFSFLQNCLKPLGRIVLLGSSEIILNDERLSFFTLFTAWWKSKNVSLRNLIMNNRVVAGLHLAILIEKCPNLIRETLEKIYHLLKIGKIKPNIHYIYSMDQIVEATKLLSERRNIGKVLISMDPNYQTS